MSIVMIEFREKRSPPILDYGRDDSPSVFRREADSIAQCFGGWTRFTVAWTLCFLGIFGGLAITHGASVYGSLWLGVLGLGAGIFVPTPQDRDGWERSAYAFFGAIVCALMGWWLFSPGWELMALFGYRIGLAIYDESQR